MRAAQVRLDELQAYDGRSPAAALMNEVLQVTRLVRSQLGMTNVWKCRSNPSPWKDCQVAPLSKVENMVPAG